jgi:hypothetical protein
MGWLTTQKCVNQPGRSDSEKTKVKHPDTAHLPMREDGGCDGRKLSGVRGLSPHRAAVVEKSKDRATWHG